MVLRKKEAIVFQKHRVQVLKSFINQWTAKAADAVKISRLVEILTEQNEKRLLRRAISTINNGGRLLTI